MSDRLRQAGLLILILTACRAEGQLNLGAPLGALSSAMHAHGLSVAAAKPQNPREPSGFPQPPSTNELPPPRNYGSDENVVQILSSGETSTYGNDVHLDNGFHVRYKGYDIYGDTLDGDRETEVFTASGNVRLIGIDKAVTGQAVTFDFRHNTYVSEKMDVDLHPTFFPTGTVLGDIYFKGAYSHGSDQEVWGDDASVTTCDYADPHYLLAAEHLDFRPGRRLIMRGVTLYILNKRIFRIPYLAIPLDTRQNHIYPEVGDDPVAGYFIKTYIPIPMHGNNQILTARLDEYSKLGTGVGLDYDYQNRRSNGMADVYGIFGRSNEQELTLQHEMRFGRDDLSLNATYSNNDYLSSPGSQLLNLRAQFSMPEVGGSFDQFAFGENSNFANGFSSRTTTATWNDSRIWNPGLHSNLSLAYSDTNSSVGGQSNGSYENRLMDVNFDATDDIKKADAEFQFSRNIPIGANSNAFFGSLQQSPSLTLKSDSNRLLSQRLAAELPFQTDLSVGQYGAPSLTGQGNQEIWRENFDFTFTRPDHPERRFDYTFDTRFQQGVYSDNTAQYVTGFDASSRYNFGPDTAFNLHYNYLQQHGFTPIDQDRTGQTNLITSDISVRPFPSLLLAAQTGYDMLAYQEGITPWQSAGLRAEWTPLSYFQMRALGTYDTTLRKISSVQVDSAYKPGATFVNLGFRYDGTQHTIGEWYLYVDAFKWGRLQSSLILDYDGYIHQFTAEHLALTYDMHCAEAVLQILDNPTGFRSGTSISFFIRLKAFPFNTPFGVGTQGQAVGAGFGRTTF